MQPRTTARLCEPSLSTEDGRRRPPVGASKQALQQAARQGGSSQGRAVTSAAWQFQGNWQQQDAAGRVCRCQSCSVCPNLGPAAAIGGLQACLGCCDQVVVGHTGQVRPGAPTDKQLSYVSCATCWMGLDGATTGRAQTCETFCAWHTRAAGRPPSANKLHTLEVLPCLLAATHVMFGYFGRPIFSCSANGPPLVHSLILPTIIGVYRSSKRSKSTAHVFYEPSPSAKPASTPDTHWTPHSAATPLVQPCWPSVR